jgi:site-specific DNA-cytosine methylase
MRVIIACEFSGAVRRAFRARGHDAWSCDLLAADDGDQHHIQGDAIEAAHDPRGWDLMIAHPPCTYLSVSGMHWTARGLRDPQLTEDALDFVRRLMDAPIKKICVENPISVISSRIRKPDQIIQPWQFGHDASKATCLWLHGLPPLRPTALIAPRIVNGKKRWGNQTDNGQNKLTPSADRWKIRSTTYNGIAQAMAEQWGAL